MNGICVENALISKITFIISIQTDYETDIADYEVLIYALTASNGQQSSNQAYDTHSHLFEDAGEKERQKRALNVNISNP